MQPELFEKPIYRIAGDTGLLIDYGEGISPEINRKVRAMAKALERHGVPGVIEVISTYKSLLIIYDPAGTAPHHLKKIMENLESELDRFLEESGRVVEIPVCYGGEFGPDLDFVASSNGLSPEQVIELHTRPEYLIYMVGFTPGFPFLGGLDPRLATQRLKTPRTRVPKGSVGIANHQTGIYPIESPGGWQLIGRTPLTLFAPEKSSPFLYQSGDRLKFIPISKAAYHTLYTKENA
jgi:inhibitor of KinA